MQLLVNFLIVFVFALVTAWLMEKKLRVKRSYQKFVVALVAALAFLGTFFKDTLMTHLNQPKFELKAGRVRGENTIFATFELLSGSLSLLSISYPIDGKITGFEDRSVIGDAQTEAYARPLHFVSYGDSYYFSEYLDLSITNVKPKSRLIYKITYESPPETDWIADIKFGPKAFAFYKVDYQWEYNRQSFRESEYRLIKNDEVSDRDVRPFFSHLNVHKTLKHGDWEKINKKIGKIVSTKRSLTSVRE